MADVKEATDGKTTAPPAAAVATPTAAPVDAKTSGAKSAPTADAARTGTPAAAGKAAPAAVVAGKDTKPAAVQGKASAAAAAPTDASADDDAYLDDDDEAPAKADGDDLYADDGDKPATETSIPDQWREIFAGGDEKALARIKRYASPQGVVKALLAAEQKIRSGEYKRGIAEDATDEEKSEWRKANGIPDKPEDYAVPEVKGYEWTDADKPLMNAFMSSMHAKHATQEQIDAMLQTYVSVTAEAKVARAEADKSAEIEVIDHLRTQWGNDYRTNTRLMQRALSDPELMPGGLGEVFKNARGPDGKMLKHNPAFAEWLGNLALDTYGAGAMVNGDAETSLTSRETELANMMRTNIDRYQNERNAKGQTYAEELLDIRRQKANSGSRNLQRRA